MSERISFYGDNSCKPDDADRFITKPSHWNTTSKIKSLTDNRYNLYVAPLYNDNLKVVLDRATACIPYSADLTEPVIRIY